MLSAESLTREEMETLLPYRLSESAILGAKAQVARRKADRAKAEWREVSQRAAEATRAAKREGVASKFDGRLFEAALSAAHALHGVSRTLEQIWKRAETDAQYWERMARKAKAKESASGCAAADVSSGGKGAAERAEAR